MSEDKNNKINNQPYVLKTYPKILSFKLNHYAMECVAFGEIEKGDVLPFEEYVSKLKLDWLTPQYFRNKVAGIAIDSEHRICVYKAVAVNAIFNYEYNDLWCMAKQEVPVGDEFELFDFDIGLASHMNKLRSLFNQIIYTDTVFPHDNHIPEFSEYEYNCESFVIAEFLLDIKNKKVKPYQCVNNYISKLSNLPYYIQRMIVNIKGEYYLMEINNDSLVYQLAVLASFKFATPDHAYIFNEKMKRWEALHHDMIEILK